MTYVIACIANYDEATSYAYPYFKNLIDELEEYGYKIVKCLDVNATKICVLHGFSEAKEEFTVFIGMSHGKPSYFTGHEGEIIFETCEIPKEALNNRVYLVYSCWTGAKLGSDFVEKGALAYLGFEKPVYVGSGRLAIFQKIAVESFKEYLTKDITIGQLRDLLKQRYEKTAEEYSYDPYVSDALKYMAKIVVLHGNENVVIPKPKPLKPHEEKKPEEKPVPKPVITVKPIPKIVEYVIPSITDQVFQALGNLFLSFIPPRTIPPNTPNWFKILLRDLKIVVTLDEQEVDVTSNFRIHRMLLNVDKIEKINEERIRKKVDIVIIGWEAIPKGDGDFLDIVMKCEYEHDSESLKCIITSTIPNKVSIIWDGYSWEIPELTKVNEVENGKLLLLFNLAKVKIPR